MGGGSIKQNHPVTVYVCHPFASDPPGHREAIKRVCRELVAEGAVPLAPQLLLPQFLDEHTERERALAMCLRLVALCDEVRVYGALSEGMRPEIAEAGRLGIPLVEGDTGVLLAHNGEPPRRGIARAAVER